MIRLTDASHVIGRHIGPVPEPANVQFGSTLRLTDTNESKDFDGDTLNPSTGKRQ